jgi:ribosomal subunit interface protein
MATNQTGTGTPVVGGEPPEGFQLDIRAHGFELTDAIRQYAIDHIATKLAAHSNRVQAVIIRVGDTNGTKGGEDKLCRVEVLIPGQNPLVIEEINEDLRAAMDLAADRIEKVLRRKVERRRAKPRQRGHKLVRNRKTLH